MAAFETVPYSIWQTCYRASNGSIELIVTGEVGPRIIRFGFVGQDNMLKEYADRVDKVGGEQWINFGGHRLWHAPEVRPRTYQPDNSPLLFEQHADFGRFTQPVEPGTGIQKEIDIAMAAGRNHVRVTHRMTNHNVWGVELAPWAISVMAAGGTGILPLPPRGEHPRDLLPLNTLAIWAYTDISDPRWTWGRKYILLRQDSGPGDPEKIGSPVLDGWVGYVNNGSFFLKTFDHISGATYPDLGSSAELFTNRTMLEVETLGPMTTIPPGGKVEHIEDWYLFDGVMTPHNDAEVDAQIAVLVQEVKGTA